MLTSNQRGRGNEPVVVLGRMRPSVAVNKGCLQGNGTRDLPAVAVFPGSHQLPYLLTGECVTVESAG